MAKPFISVRDKATSGITKVRNSLKSVGKTVAKPFVTLRDKASAPLGKVGGVLKSVGKTVAKPFIGVMWMPGLQRKTIRKCIFVP